MKSKRTGLFLQCLRKEKGITQDELARKLHVDRSIISKWERGIYTPTTEMLLKLEKIFGVSVNELLYGEKKTKENEKAIEEIPLKLLDEKKKQIKKVTIVSVIICLLLLISFLILYFLNTYNSIRVYMLYGSSSTVGINQGIMVVSKEKSYIELGPIYNSSEYDIEELTLYYIKNEKELLLFSSEGEEPTTSLVNNFSIEPTFSYSDLNTLKNNLYLRIRLSDGNSYTMKIRLEKDFSNNSLFSKNTFMDASEIDVIDKDDSSIPKYIRENFQFDSIHEKYYLETEKDNMKIKQEYFISLKIYDVTETFEDGFTKTYEKIYDTNDFLYYEIKEDKMFQSFSYNDKTENCIAGNCDENILNYFQNTYLNIVEK